MTFLTVFYEQAKILTCVTPCQELLTSYPQNKSPSQLQLEPDWVATWLLERDDQRVLLAASRAIQSVNVIRALGGIAKLEFLQFAGAGVRMGGRV
jgi:hypothetical protein